MEKTSSGELSNTRINYHRDHHQDPSSSSNNENVIKFHKISDIFQNQNDLTRFEHFVEQFKETYEANKKPDYVICAPGRINIIGEHIDYHGFSVLPMALKQSIWMAISIENHDYNKRGHIKLVNTCKSIDRSSWHGEHSLQYASKLMTADHHWKNYFLCAYQGVLAHRLMGLESDELLASRYANGLDSNQDLDAELNKLPSVNVLVHSDLPAASGLSSSSALVCASALATILSLNKCRATYNNDSSTSLLDRMQIANDCSKFEHLIGTQGGGMDQAIIMTAQKDYAKLVQFQPEFNCENVRLPEDVVWLVSHSGVDYCKAATSGFNRRVLETKIGASLIAQHHNFSDDYHHSKFEVSTLTLGKLRTTIFKDLSTNEIIEHLRNQVFAHIGDQLTIDEICQKLKLTKSQFREKFKVNEEILTNDEPLSILPRCEHVFEEADRVLKFKSICDTTTNTVLLGQLMTQSHSSLRDKFQCSHPALDRLVSAALESGALGSRLTGAGWGGCVVTMVESSKRDTVYERLNELSDATFMTKPESGCCVIKLD